jgi:ribose transport system permease protein
MNARRVLAADGVPSLFTLLVVFAIFSLTSSEFLSIENVRNILVQSTFVLFISVGMTFVLTVGAIDLSVGAVLGLSAGVTIFVISLGVPSAIAILAGVAVGVCFGLLNGFMVAWLRLNDFIVTLGTLGIAAGSLQLLDSFRPLRATGADYFTGLAHGVWWGVPVPVIIAVVVVGFMSAVMQLSDYGRRLQATGMNSAAANLAGVNVRSIRLSVFALSGFFSGLAGVIMAAHLSSVSAGLGRGFELQAIAAAVVGGTSLRGGRGNVIGAALAAVLLAAIANGLQLTGVDVTWFQIIVGASIVAAVAFHQWTVRSEARSPTKNVVVASVVGSTKA